MRSTPALRTPERLAAIAAAIALLAETFPKAFFIYERRRRPLKLGIHLDILAVMDGVITAEELSDALRFYVSNDSYLRTCREGAVRIDLNGEPVGKVSAEDAANSTAVLASRRLRQAAQKKAQVAEPVQSAPVQGRLGLAELKAAARARKAAYTK